MRWNARTAPGGYRQAPTVRRIYRGRYAPRTDAARPHPIVQSPMWSPYGFPLHGGALRSAPCSRGRSRRLTTFSTSLAADEASVFDFQSRVAMRQRTQAVGDDEGDRKS